MIWLAALVAASASPPASLSSVTGTRAEARATVRILTAARLTLDGKGGPGLPAVRDSLIDDQGTIRPAKLIEFQ